MSNHALPLQQPQVASDQPQAVDEMPRASTISIIRWLLSHAARLLRVMANFAAAGGPLS